MVKCQYLFKFSDIITWKEITLTMKTCSLPPLVVCFALIFLASHVIGSSNLKLAIVNHDAEQKDRQCTFNDSCSLRNLSCRYITYLWQQPISETYYTDLDSTVQGLRTSRIDASAVVYLNENFTDAFVAKMALGDDADSETVDAAQIHVWLNKAKRTDSIKQLLQAAFDNFTKNIMSSCGFTRDHGRFTFNNNFQYRYV